MPVAVLLAVGLAAVLLASCSGGGPSAPSSVQIPATPVGRQLQWVLTQLNAGGGTLTKADVVQHFTPEYLQTHPPEELIQLFGQTSAQTGRITLTGFSRPLDATQAIGLIRAKKSVEGSKGAAAYINVESGGKHRISYLNLGDLPGPSARDLSTPGPSTGAFDVGGGRRLFLDCVGSGSPTVILEAGAGGGADAWTKVQPEVGSFTRVCSYDRANIPGGASDPAPKPRTADDVVADLHAALTAAGVPGPLVLAGHSDGGLFVRLYASRYPDAVAGLVLVDSYSENQDAAEAAVLKKVLPRAQWIQYQAALQYQAHAPFVAHADDEQIDMTASSDEMRAAMAKSPLQPMPLFVLTHGVPFPPSPGEPPGLSAAKERASQQLQDELARLVPNAKHVVVEHSGHDIQNEQPEAVIDAIKQVVRAVRDPGTWHG